MDKKKIAIFGATGYVGLILTNRMISADSSVKLFVRNKMRLRHLSSVKNVQSCDIELTYENVPLIAEELQDCDVIYYLIQSMSNKKSKFTKLDFTLAKVVAQAAKKSSIEQIIFLGGLGLRQKSFPISAHLASRQKVGILLASTGVSVTEIRTGIIVGAGSASYEIIKALGSKLPFIPKLSYAVGLCQPVDIDDVITYLLHVYKNPLYFGKVIEIGAEDKLSYQQIIQIYAKSVLGRNLRIINIPLIEKIIDKKAISTIIAFLSAIPYTLAKPLIDSIGSKAIIGEFSAEHIEPRPPKCISYEESVKKANRCEVLGLVESFWSIPLKHQVLSRDKEKFLYVDSKDERVGFLEEKRERIIEAKYAKDIFAECLKVGGKHGYWSPRWMWKARAFLDKLIGGTGLESGRQTRDKLTRIGERIDFWIVSDYVDEQELKVLTLKARLKSPGSSWLQFALVKIDEERWKFMLSAYFKPKGFRGYVYWYTLWLIHKYIFSVIISNIIKEALKGEMTSL